MSISRLRLRYLFDHYYNNTATLDERDELFALIETGAKDEELSALIRKAWGELEPDTTLFEPATSEGILKKILSADPSKKNSNSRGIVFLWTKISVAAVALLFVGYGIKLYISTPKRQQIAIAKVKAPSHDVLPGGNKAVLTLSNGETIVLDNAKNGTLAKEGKTVVKKMGNGQLLYNAAALSGIKRPPSINTIATPRGGQYQVILPDGTKVWLNSASWLRFPTYFAGKSRDVEINGEAYFEVAKNKAMPFRVKTSRANIEVLGTHFNVMAYDDEAVMKTTLLEGAVNITNGTFTAKLIPGQQAQIGASGQSKVVNNVDVDDETAWKNGVFQFRDAGIDAILRQAARWYDVEIVYKTKLPAKEFTGSISRNVKASALLNMLNYTGANLKIEGKNIIVL
jgi:transmembrane sensor